MEKGNIDKEGRRKLHSMHNAQLHIHTQYVLLDIVRYIWYD